MDLSSQASASIEMSAAEAARLLVASFARVAPLADKVQRVHGEVANALGRPADAAGVAMRSAGEAIAAAIDRDPGRHDRLPYHNRQHFCEVMLAGQLLGRQAGVGDREARLMLLAALMHDLDHDGTSASDFMMERRSVAHALPFLQAARVDASTCAALAALVLATEPRAGVGHAIAVRAGRGSAGLPVEMRILAQDPRLAEAAALLCEADILPSVGLTAAHAMTLQARLSQEWHCPLAIEDKARFIDDVIAAGVIGDWFMPNVLALRRSLGPAADG